MGKTDWGVDFSEIKSDFSLLPDGTYHAEIESHEASVSQQGNEVLNFRYSILDDAVENGSGETVKVRGRILFDSIPVTPQTAFRYRNLLTAAGFDDETINNDTPEPEELYGKEILAIVTHEPIKRHGQITDDMRNVVKKVARV